MTEQGQNGVDRLEDWLLLRSAFYAGRVFLEQLRRRKNTAVAGIFERLQRMFLLGISGREFPHRNQAEEARFREARYCPLCGQKITTHFEDGTDQIEEETQGIMVIDDEGLPDLCEEEVGNNYSDDPTMVREVESGYTQTCIETESSCLAVFARGLIQPLLDFGISIELDLIRPCLGYLLIASPLW